MAETLTLGGFALALAALLYSWRRRGLRRDALDRLFGDLEATAPLELPTTRNLRRPLARPWRWAPAVLGLAVLAGVYWIVHWPLQFAVAFGVIVALLGHQLEAFLADRRAVKMENQLSDAIDIMVGALGAGAGVTHALHAAIAETRMPLRGELEEVLGRIRLGDDARLVFRSLANRVPLETFLLFATTLGVHWETGGSLAPTLATIGRTIRDRIETARRIRSNIAQSQISTIVILLLTYFIAAVVWRNSPDQMRAFLGTSLGASAVAGSMMLQAVGLVWMNWISKIRF
jgi:tight adherence protein B